MWRVFPPQRNINFRKRFISRLGIGGSIRGQELGTCENCKATGVECIGIFSAGGIQLLCKNCYSTLHEGIKLK